ncbi:MAG: hypothetical protein ACFFCZ_20280 [Promethearchaeota archaeon]
MTENQALTWYWESFSQEARERLHRLEELMATKSPKALRDLEYQLVSRAYPADPESDGDFDKDDLKMLKNTIGKFEEVNIE